MTERSQTRAKVTRGADSAAGEEALPIRWIVENNQLGILNGYYSGGQPYTTREGGPASFVKWYMGEVVSREGQRTSA